MNNYILFFNRCFDKKRLKNFILWFFNKYGERATIQLVEDLKKIGFQHATNAGISIGIDDLKIPSVKSDCINLTEQKIKRAEISYHKGNITEIERQQQFVDEWNLISEKLKRHVIQFFKATDIFNPIYMMAFSGARGNISQIRQLIGMRGLMADPQGQILDFPIRSSFREGLTLTEYLISCYGARKGVVDTALRTATSGYLTRRLVDVTQQVVIGRQNCNTSRGIIFTNLIDGKKTLLSLKDRLIGRVLCDDILIISSLTKKKSKIGFKNQEISTRLAKKIYDSNNNALIKIRSPLTCSSKNSICQLCYGWNLAYNAIVSIGEAVGVLAAQSIGEPGTQLTMRTFHTGGVFTGGLIDQIYSPFNGEVNYVNNFNGVLIRTLKGQIGFLTKTDGALQVKTKYTNNLSIKSQSYTPEFELANLFFSNQLKKILFNRKQIYSLLIKKIFKIEKNLNTIKNFFHPSLIFNIPRHAILFIRHGSLVREKELIAELSSISLSENLRQETEQDVFAPITGQAFFEKLILIEKTKRDGSIQKTTYGLGSLWIISARTWNSRISPYIFPAHGDLISSSSIVQKLQILNKKYCYFDQSISDSVYAFEDFKSSSFLNKQSKILGFKTKSINNILLNQTFYSNNFQKIYYKNFRYFVLINNRNNFLNDHLYSKKNNLSIRENISQKTRANIGLNYFILGLNFRFYQSNIKFHIQKQKSKTNFLLYSIQNKINQNKEQYFFSFLKSKNLIQSRLKKIVISRKRQKHANDVLNKSHYQHWYDIYSSYFINISVKSTWIFYKKKSSKNFDFILLKRNHNLYKLVSKLEKITNQTKNINTFKIREYNVSKFFLINFNIRNFCLCFNSLEALDNFNWISAKQANFLLVNRQSNVNFQISKLWGLPKSNIFQNFVNNIYNYRSEKKRLSCNFSFFVEQIYRIKLNLKPILINPSILLGFHHKNKKFHLNYYFIEKFFISFYYEWLLNLKINSYFFNPLKTEDNKIGFQTQFKILATPIFLIKESNNTENIIQIKRFIFKDEPLTFFKKFDLYKENIKKQQISIDWPCTYRNKIFIDDFGYCLNFGVGFKQNIYFDRHPIILDIVYNQNYKKFDLLSFFSYKKFHKLKIRFLAHRLLSENLIVFQKIQKCVDWRLYYSKTLNLNSNYKNYEYHNSLIFNFAKTYFTNFHRSIINKNNSFHFFLSKYNIEVLNKNSVFFKINFLQILYNKVKTLVNLEYPVLLKTYSPIKYNQTKLFSFKKSYYRVLEKNNSNYYIFNNLIHFSVKLFCLNSIQKLNFQTLLNNNNNNIQILYKNFNSYSVRNPIYINFSECLQNGEIIQLNLEKQDLEKKFIVLTQSNLKSFKLEYLHNKINPNALMLNNFLRYGTALENQKIVSTGGQVIFINKKSFTIRKAIPFLITSKSLLNVHQDELIKKGSRLFTFLSYQLKTGDIIQGIPKIEEFFEARLTRDGLPLLTNLHTQIKQLFRNYRLKFSVFEATKKSFEKIQYLIINEIQKVYCSQGIYIADKHLEIVVRQMTTKVQVIKGGKTGLLCGELIELDWIHAIEQKFSGEDILYEPIILGITKSCLETESFISAASFQETTRILTKAAIQNKIDFIRGLKQNVILGNLVPAGTGFFSPLYIKYSNFD